LKVWWKLTGLGFIEAALIAVLFWPIQTHAVKYDTAEAARGHGWDIATQAVFGLGGPVLLIAAIFIPIWMAYRVLRTAGR
jgi:hypothetical protein